MIRGRKEYMISYDGLYELIPNDRFITKTELIQLTGLSDRVLRDMVSHIKMNKTIISNCDKKGYKRGRKSRTVRAGRKPVSFRSDFIR